MREASGLPLILAGLSSALGVLVCPRSSPLRTHLFFLTGCREWGRDAPGASTGHWSNSLTWTLNQLLLVLLWSNSACYTLQLSSSWLSSFVVYFAPSPALCLSKAYLTLQERFKSHPLQEAFPGSYNENEPLSPTRSPSAFAVSLFWRLMHPALCGSSVYVSPCEFLEGSSDVSLAFVSPKATIARPDAGLEFSKCLLTWSLVRFALSSGPFGHCPGCHHDCIEKTALPFWALCSCFIYLYDAFIHSSCIMPEAKHFGDTFSIRLNVWRSFRVERLSPDVLRVFFWNFVMKINGVNNWI